MSDPTRIQKNGSPRPPLHIPLGHTAFRMLCHASRIGGIIGKSGAIIKNLQHVTGAKIRIEDAPPDAPDRIVTIIGPTSPVPTGDGPSEISRAQEALVRVFERVLDVAAESEVRDGGVVSCRLVAGPPQVGSVIGKGGRVVERIRKETGCKIRALSSNGVRGVFSLDEIIEV